MQTMTEREDPNRGENLQYDSPVATNSKAPTTRLASRHSSIASRDVLIHEVHVDGDRRRRSCTRRRDHLRMNSSSRRPNSRGSYAFAGGIDGDKAVLIDLAAQPGGKA